MLAGALVTGIVSSCSNILTNKEFSGIKGNTKFNKFETKVITLLGCETGLIFKYLPPFRMRTMVPSSGCM